MGWLAGCLAGPAGWPIGLPACLLGGQNSVLSTGRLLGLGREEQTSIRVTLFGRETFLSVLVEKGTLSEEFVLAQLSLFGE